MTDKQPQHDQPHNPDFHDAVRAMGEDDRTGEFKELRGGLLATVSTLYERYKAGRKRPTKKSDEAQEGDNLKIVVKDKVGHDVVDRTVYFDPDAFKRYEQDGGYAPAGKTDVIASFEESTHSDMSHEWERIGWEITGDGNVNRLVYATDAEGHRVEARDPVPIHDPHDLQAVTEYIQTVIEGSPAPESLN